MNDWLKNVPDETLISEINIPGTHDSGTMYCDFRFFSRCQNTSIYDQLNMGIRFLDIRLEKKGDTLYVCHSISKCYKDKRKKERLTFDRVFKDCRQFLADNPSETIIMSLKRDHGPSSEEVFDTFFDFYSDNKVWYLKNKNPALGKVRGKIVLFNRLCVDTSNTDFVYDDTNTGLNFSGFPDQSRGENVGYAVSVIPRRDGKRGEKFFVQDLYKLTPKKKWEKGVLPILENPLCDKGFAINFFSASKGLNNPKRTAKFIYKKFSEIKLLSLKKYGWCIMDFPDEKVCRKIALTNF